VHVCRLVFVVSVAARPRQERKQLFWRGKHMESILILSNGTYNWQDPCGTKGRG